MELSEANTTETILRSWGLRVTPQRTAVLDILRATSEHPSAESLFLKARESMPAISLKTVYQILHDFAALGEVDLLEVGTGQARFDANPRRHHHLVCSTCGEIRDIYLDSPRDTWQSEVAELEAGIAAGVQSMEDFEAEKVEVVVKGRCARCRTPVAGKSPNPPPQEASEESGTPTVKYSTEKGR